MAGEPLRLIVGLGNPGTEYARTRHNAGFQFLDELARRHGAVFRSEPRHRAELARARIGESELWLLKPMNYMNRSGDPLRSVASFYKVPVGSVLVAYDELDFPAGVVRLRQGRGAAGHNGMRDVIAQVGDGFWRVRIGIGHPGDRSQVLALTARKIQASPGQGARRRERAALAIAGDQPGAQPSGLHDAQPLRQHGPRRGLVGGMETAWPQPGQPGLGVADHRVPAAHLRPATPIDVQRQEPARLRGGHIKITIASQHDACGIPGLGHLCLDTAPVTLGTEHRAQLRTGRVSR